MFITRIYSLITYNGLSDTHSIGERLMKTLRLFTIVLLAVLVISSWAPAPAYAQPSDSPKTGGTLFISFSGDRGYSFSTSNQGKTTFEAVILPGKYTVTVRTSACSGTLTYKKTVKGGTVGLPPFVCKNKNKKKK
jgi:hypothetical protein